MNDFYDDVPAENPPNQLDMAQDVFATGPAPGQKEPVKPIDNNIPKEANSQQVSEPLPDLQSGDIIQVEEVKVIDKMKLTEVSMVGDGEFEPGCEILESHTEKVNDKMVPVKDNPMPIVQLDPMSSAALEIGLEEESKKRALIVKFIQSHLIDGVDYGAIEGTSKSGAKFTGKKSLWKPGAEKVCSLLHVKPTFSRDGEIYEMLGDAYTTKHGLIAFKCHLISSTGEVLAEGRGSRNAITQESNDINKAIKMAQKSAQVDATLRMSGLSDQFTQDLEDTPIPLVGPAPGKSINSPSTGGNNYQKYLDHFTSKNDNANTIVANYLVECNVTSADRLTTQQFSIIKSKVEAL